METHNLKAASEYLNNLLLARGLLRHGNPIDFAKPAGEGDYQDAPMPRIINLIHDLLMRRDVCVTALPDNLVFDSTRDEKLTVRRCLTARS
jgi:hypothetical protein